MNVTNVNYVSSLRVLSVYPKLLPAKYRSFRLYVRAYVYVCMCAPITLAQNTYAYRVTLAESLSRYYTCPRPMLLASFPRSLFTPSLFHISLHLVFTSITPREELRYIDPSRILFARIPTSVHFRYRYFGTWLQRYGTVYG